MEAGFHWLHTALREAKTDSQLLQTGPRELQQGFICVLARISVPVTSTQAPVHSSQFPVHSSQVPVAVTISGAGAAAAAAAVAAAAAAVAANYLTVLKQYGCGRTIFPAEKFMLQNSCLKHSTKSATTTNTQGGC